MEFKSLLVRLALLWLRLAQALLEPCGPMMFWPTTKQINNDLLFSQVLIMPNCFWQGLMEATALAMGQHNNALEAQRQARYYAKAAKRPLCKVEGIHQDCNRLKSTAVVIKYNPQSTVDFPLWCAGNHLECKRAPLARVLINPALQPNSFPVTFLFA